MEKNNIKRTADKIVVECKSDPQKIAAYINSHAIDDKELLTELYLRASTLAGRFLN